jgi:tetratricopeptide (TPR) repeat protein
MSDRILLRQEIIDRIKKTFKSRNQIKRFSSNELTKDINRFLEDNKDSFKIKDRFDYDFNYHPKTIECAINRKQRSEYGADEPLRSILCHYAFSEDYPPCGLDYEKTLELVFGTSLEKEKAESERIKGHKEYIKESVQSKEDIVLNDSNNQIVIKNSNGSVDLIPFDTSNDSYNVLLFPFQPFEYTGNKSDIEGVITAKLKDMSNLDNLNLQIQYYSDYYIQSYNEAESIGINLNAHLVIWGELYEHRFNDNKEAYLKFVNISNENLAPGILEKGKSEIEKMITLAEVKEGRLLKDIDYIIYWVAASRAYSKMDYVTALKHFNKIKDSGKTKFELYLSIANCYFILQSFQEAKFHYEKLLEPIPNDIDDGAIQYEIKDIIRENGQLEPALLLYPNYAEVYNNYACLLNTLNDKERAKENYEKALIFEPNNCELHYNYALILDDLNDKKGAIKQYKIALKIKPDFAEAHNNYSIILREIGNLKGAIKHRKLAFKVYEDALDHFEYAMLLDEDNNKKGAIKHFKIALELKPDFAEAHKFYAKFLDKSNDKKGAKEHYEKALTHYPNDYKLHYDYANLLLDLKDKKGAIKYIKRALKINRDYKDAHILYAIIYYDMNNMDGAKEHLKKVLKIEPNDVFSNKFYADILFKSNEIDGAKEHYERALKHCSNYGKFHLDYATFLKDGLSDMKMAKRHYLKAIRLQPDLKTKERDENFGL